MSATTKWITLALLGLLIAGAVAFLASRLVSEQIGIASESVSAGYELAPAVRSATAPNKTGNDATTPNNDTTASDDAVGPKQLEDELADRAKQREDELEDLEKEREDREDEVRDEEEDRRDD